MAFTALVPTTVNPTITKGAAQSFASPIVNTPGGSPVNLSAWVSLAAKLVPPTPNPTGADVTFGTVTAASTGIVTLTTAAADLSTAEPGTARLLITGKPTSGDDPQILVSGVATILQG